MIRITCPGCHSKIHAKDKLAGQVRKCPKCQMALRIPAADDSEAYRVAEPAEPLDVPADTDAPQAAATETVPAEQTGSMVHDALDHDLATVDVPDRLARHNHYLICDRTRVIALWKGDGQGWQIKVGNQLASARRNQDQLPNQGNFQLVELKMKPVEGGVRLVGIMTYQLTGRYALPALARGEDEILEKITGPGRLTRDQKGAIKLFILNNFMHPVWEEAQEVLDFLSSPDYHSPGVG